MWTNITLLSSHHAQLELLSMFIDDQDAQSAPLQYSLCEERFLELSPNEQRQHDDSVAGVGINHAKGISLFCGE